MEHIRATRSVSITELKRSPSAVIEQAGQEAVAVLNHNRPAAYLLSATAYDNLLEKIEASAIREAIAASRRDPRVPLSTEQVFGEMEACITQASADRPGAVEDGRVIISPLLNEPLTLEQRLARFDRSRHGGEAMASASLGADQDD